MRSPDLLLIPEKLKSLGNVTDVVDESWPAYDLGELYKRYSGTLIGDYIAIFWPKRVWIPWKKRRCIMGFRHCLRQAAGDKGAAQEDSIRWLSDV